MPSASARAPASARPELLAPAGGPEAAYAALAYGADAVYLGLPQFSARAEAVNFTPAELAEVAGHAHSLTPRRKIYLTLNTLVKDAEAPAILRALGSAVIAGIDAVIVQDIGLAGLVRRVFPELPLHASTQMAIHSLAGGRAARDLGFSRVTLARELTLEEVRIIRAGLDIEVETFIHGALCYSYSGLCLFSSLALGRSGNRGRCAYSCREGANLPDGRLVHPFSLKDLALGPAVLELARAGVASLKIEGRKKSPLYVAAVVDYYRRILDGNMTPALTEEAEGRIKTIFARPWTTFFFSGPRNPAAADPLVVGHRGLPIGRVAGQVTTPAGPGLAFTPGSPIERHDGLQIDLPGVARPFGFGVDNLYAATGGRLKPEFAVPAGTPAAVALPEGSPPVPPGAEMYLSSSQEVKRLYPFRLPPAGEALPRRPVTMDVAVEPATDTTARVRLRVRLVLPVELARRGIAAPETEVTADVPAFPARDAAGAEAAARAALARLGADGLELGGLTFANPAGLFVRPGDWNRLRRDAAAEIVRALGRAEEEYLAAIEKEAETESVTAEAMAVQSASAPPTAGWLLYVDSPEALSSLTPADLAAAREVAVAVPSSPDTRFEEDIAALARTLGPARLRLALPLVARDGLHGGFGHWLERLAAGGCSRFLVPSLAGWRHLRARAGLDMLGMVADWPLYVTNRHAGRRLLEMGFSAVTLSPEDDAGNIRPLLAAFPAARVVAYGHLPLFISASCAHANLGLCRTALGEEREGRAGAPASCPPALRLRLEKSGSVDIWPQSCGTVVTAAGAYSLAGVLPALRGMGATNFVVDLRWRPAAPAEVARVWRACLAGQPPPGTPGNFTRGLL